MSNTVGFHLKRGQLGWGLVSCIILITEFLSTHLTFNGASTLRTNLNVTPRFHPLSSSTLACSPFIEEFYRLPSRTQSECLFNSIGRSRSTLSCTFRPDSLGRTKHQPSPQHRKISRFSGTSLQKKRPAWEAGLHCTNPPRSD